MGACPRPECECAQSAHLPEAAEDRRQRRSHLPAAMGRPTWCWCAPWRAERPAPSPRAVPRPRRWHDGCHHDQPHRAGRSVGRSAARMFLFTNIVKFLITRLKKRPATHRGDRSNPDKMLTLIVGCRYVGERAADDPIRSDERCRWWIQNTPSHCPVNHANLENLLYLLKT